ncbi:MAG TPA: GTP cyclohydrolase II RibA [Alphaproteobacteria bacterium]
MLNNGFGDPAILAAHRALSDFRAGAPIIVRDGDVAEILISLDGFDDARLARLRAAWQPLGLAVTSHRAAALGDRSGGIVVPLANDMDIARIVDIASAPAVKLCAPGDAANSCVLAALELAKIAQLLPAALVLPVTPETMAAFGTQASDVRVADVMRLRAAATHSTRLVSRARVPLHENLATEFVVFRDMLGRNMTAVVVGAPDLTQAVPVRLHSCCLTGDVFSSRRCDCGDQLQMSLDILSEKGGGVLLYLDQEGCGIGLANKMRAYGLQDRGLDTIDANTTLGFATDERRYDAAARMLELLGITRVSLLTNNPAKLSGLAEHGIEIAGRIPLLAPVNSSNKRYLDAKARRAGHLLEGLNEPAPPVHSRA